MVHNIVALFHEKLNAILVEENLKPEIVGNGDSNA